MLMTDHKLDASSGLRIPRPNKTEPVHILKTHPSQVRARNIHKYRIINYWDLVPIRELEFQENNLINVNLRILSALKQADSTPDMSKYTHLAGKCEDQTSNANIIALKKKSST